MSVTATIQDETTQMQDYIRKMAPNDFLLRESFRQQKHSEEKEEEERPSWRDKTLHGMYHRQIEEVADIENWYQWLEKAGPGDRHRGTDHSSTRSGLEQTSIEPEFYHTRLDRRGRRCKNAPATV